LSARLQKAIETAEERERLRRELSRS